MIQPQLVELCSFGSSVDTMLDFDTLKHRDFQFIMDTTTGFDTILHNILKLNLSKKFCFQGVSYPIISKTVDDRVNLLANFLNSL